jgi:hypothetical protein
MVKLSLCLINYALCHEDMGKWKYSSTILLDLSSNSSKAEQIQWQ